MTRRRELQAHRRSLGEIREILDSMKTLAYMETRKLSRFIEAQHAVRVAIESAAADFIAFHPQLLPEPQGARRFYLLVGSERGFCADFNHQLLRQLPDEQGLGLLLCGQKLHSELEQEPRVVEAIEGATVAEDVASVLNHLVARLLALQGQYGSIELYALYHDGIDNRVVSQALLPPFQHCRNARVGFTDPPVLTLAPQELMLQLSEHYLFAVLNEILYSSLMAENHLRVAHLDAAVNHLDEEGERLQRRSNALWQEEITEEIEVLLLNTAAGDDGPWD